MCEMVVTYWSAEDSCSHLSSSLVALLRLLNSYPFILLGVQRKSEESTFTSSTHFSYENSQKPVI